MTSHTELFGGIFKEKRVLITGHTGFKGSWLTLWLSRLGAHVCGLSMGVPSQPSMFEVLGLRDRIVHKDQDIRDFTATSRIVEDVRPDFVFHLAAQAIVSRSYGNPLETISTNTLGTAHVLEALRILDRPCVAVFITSDKCYDNVEWAWGYRETDPLGGKDVYSGSKGAAELVFKSYFHSFFKKEDGRVRAATARAGNVIGGGDWAPDRIVPDCMRAWSRGNTVEIRNPRATRPWQHVLEPLSGYLALGRSLAENPALNGDSFNFGPSPEANHTVEDLIGELGRFWDFTGRDKAFRIAEGAKFHEAGLLKLNCDKALARLSWSPTLSYPKLIEFTGRWYREYYRGGSDMADITSSQIAEYEAFARDKGSAWTR